MIRRTISTFAAIGFAFLTLAGCVNEGGRHSGYDRGPVYQQRYNDPNYRNRPVHVQRQGPVVRSGRSDWDGRNNDRGLISRPGSGHFEVRHGQRVWVPNR